ncbi:hypothetical protein HYH02_012519 [Chlamydomonas schloesseri]|uniref:BTB domain-containing protein n=1 Tax=Chlamydomonas schloesseri TaxID=2026947 RepID=A0A835W1C5_9CHLO|nr:hypothetical protein HYH02_012519 [Chlamydomonas schloesseri]|eukprot:KAG2433588.1 hypothetical protein HYH02_012519 [Chlamydomonas schloesseri]
MNPYVTTPPIYWRIVVPNWKDPAQDVVLGGHNPNYFNPSTPSWGYKEAIALSKLTTSSGFLRRDGALLLRLELELSATAAAAAAGRGGGRAYPTNLEDGIASRSDMGSDFLSLLNNPGPTSDLTILATAPGVVVVKEEPKKGKKRKTSAASSCSSNSTKGLRRFPVHRAVLAARCPYFAMHFASGMRDSKTRELHMPDTDPDALAALLRFVYGGKLTVTSREHARCCFELADRLLLPKAVALLREHLLSTLSTSEIFEDLTWAADMDDGQEELLTGMVDFAAEAQEELPQAAVADLAATHPALVAQLFTARARAATRTYA